ncbi:uncharacterized protein LOC110112516 [Dendrobium catenatum]|uniref:DUF4283 domain-containing protein n=1 Tax=Dendrobium catenatum TaxID=906689 RepID=A0A2I0W176_9ASPA|nr:uncharacterized protein LOC110112516 [Dendrobium catenatum]PKU69397.1 hypothetical protein MA16_Dca025257 [Dendrobium catenatum]
MARASSSRLLLCLSPLSPPLALPEDILPSVHMEAGLLSSDFPPLSQSPSGKAKFTPKNWNLVFAPETSAPKALNLSHFPDEPEIVPFSNDSLSKGGEDWSLCLVGYSIGRRPFYEALQGAIKKTWSLKGSVQLLSLNDGFFLISFSCTEDYDMVWSWGVWFLLGRPFILQKWHPKFKPIRDNFASVPIWVKIHDLPLACWNLEGISRIASKISIPLAADNLNEQKTRLTFARICVLVDCNATYQEKIKVSLDGDVVCLKVQYEWRPIPCDHCKSLMHYSSLCPSKPKVHGDDETAAVNTQHHGRSFSRKPKNRYPSSKIFSRPPIRESQQPHPPSLPPSTTALVSHNNNSIGQPLLYQPHSPSPFNVQEPISNIVVSVENLISNPSANVLNNTVIPNLNSPNGEEVASTSSCSLHIQGSQKVMELKINSPNKFEVLNVEEEESSFQEEACNDLDVRDNWIPKQKQNDKSKLNNSVASKKTTMGKQVKKSHTLKS